MMPMRTPTNSELQQIWTLLPYRGRLVFLTNASEATLYYSNYSLDLLTFKKRPWGIAELLRKLEQRKISSSSNNPVVTHLFYELGHELLNNGEMIDPSTPLALDITFKNFISNTELELSNKKIILKKEYEVSKELYEKQFEQGYQHLLKGDCYQFNLTNQYLFSWDHDLTQWQWVSRLWSNPSSRGAYGSATYIPGIDLLYFSNSPECLFQIEKLAGENRLYSMPIKGTLKISKSEDLKSLWTELIACEKNESELLMITDLIRNDLSAIEKPVSKVEKLKAPLIVPGLLHQYSKVSVSLSDEVNLKDILMSIFPGGSITGAPKKRVMEILKEIETVERGFYCGSTLISFKNLVAASINIRSAIINLTQKTLSYGAGGGITLQSNYADELSESKQKLNSFKRLL